MFQGYTLHSANLKSCQVTHSYSGQLNNKLLSSLQVVIAYH